MLPAVFKGFDIFNTIPFKIIFQIGAHGDLPYIRFLDIPIEVGDYIFWTLFLIIVYFSYYALLGAFAGFISNELLKVKIKIDEENDSIDYLDFYKRVTERGVDNKFLAFGVILTIIAVAVPSYFLWDWNINIMIW